MADFMHEGPTHGCCASGLHFGPKVAEPANMAVDMRHWQDMHCMNMHALREISA